MYEHEVFAETALLVAAMNEDDEEVARRVSDMLPSERAYLRRAMDRIENAMNAVTV